MFGAGRRGLVSYHGQENSREVGGGRPSVLGIFLSGRSISLLSLQAASHIPVFGTGVLLRKRAGSWWWWGWRVLVQVAALGWPAWSTENPRGSAKRLRVGRHVSLYSPADCAEPIPQTSAYSSPALRTHGDNSIQGCPTHIGRASPCLCQGTRGTDLGSLLARMLDLTL